MRAHVLEHRGFGSSCVRQGKQYMKIDGAVDERNDPLRATEAAAKKLQKNFQMLGNWPLAVTAYNHGPYGMRRLVKKI